MKELLERARRFDARTQLVAAAALLAQALAALAEPAPVVAADAMLTAAEAAVVAGVSARWLYDHAHELPFARRLGRLVRFSRSGLAKWLESRR